MREKILQLFYDASIQRGKTYEQRCIEDYNFDVLADKIIEMIEESEIDKIIENSNRQEEKERRVFWYSVIWVSVMAIIWILVSAWLNK